MPAFPSTVALAASCGAPPPAGDATSPGAQASGAFYSPLAVPSLPPGGSRAPLLPSDDGTPGPVCARLSARPIGPGDNPPASNDRFGDGLQAVLVAPRVAPRPGAAPRPMSGD